MAIKKITGDHSVPNTVAAMSGQPMSISHKETYLETWKVASVNAFFTDLAAENQATHDGLLVLNQIEDQFNLGNYITNPVWNDINDRLPSNCKIEEQSVGDLFVRQRSLSPNPVWFCVINGILYKWLNYTQNIAFYYWSHAHMAKAHATQLNTENSTQQLANKIQSLGNELSYNISVIAGDSAANYSLATSFKKPISASIIHN